MLSSLQGQLAAWDLHPKVVRDFAVRTKSGAAVSLAAVALACALLVSEFIDYRTVEVVEHLEVDPIRGSQMRIDFEVAFPSMPCAVVSLDLMDAAGHQQVDVLSNIYKRRIDAHGMFIAQAELGTRSTIKSVAQLKNLTATAAEAGGLRTDASGAVCGDCYGAGAEGQCCSTCEEVRNAYRCVPPCRCYSNSWLQSAAATRHAVLP
jgi:endoplasmic reticulum-Golgi intermediate compartment protein 3